MWTKMIGHQMRYQFQCLAFKKQFFHIPIVRALKNLLCRKLHGDRHRIKAAKQPVLTAFQNIAEIFLHLRQIIPGNLGINERSIPIATDT